MLGNRRLARAIADKGWHALRRQLAYKTAWRRGELVAVDRCYPSNKTCSCCGHVVRQLDLGTRQWECPGAGQSTSATSMPP
jgi:putative transposase